jgi:hypothetical protein
MLSCLLRLNHQLGLVVQIAGDEAEHSPPRGLVQSMPLNVPRERKGNAWMDIGHNALILVALRQSIIAIFL